MPVIIYIRYFIIRDEMHYECTNMLISINVLKTHVLILTKKKKYIYISFIYIYIGKPILNKHSISKVQSFGVVCSVNQNTVKEWTLFEQCMYSMKLKSE